MIFEPKIFERLFLWSFYLRPRLRGLTSRRSQPPLALSVPLRGSRFFVGGGSAFFVRPRDTFRFELAGLAGDDLSS
jgi:hypothetical protein